MIEPEIAALAAQRATPTEAASILAFTEGMEGRAFSPGEVYRLNIEFHAPIGDLRTWVRVSLP